MILSEYSPKAKQDPQIILDSKKKEAIHLADLSFVYAQEKRLEINRLCNRKINIFSTLLYFYRII